jgi:hypothetical protein
MRVRLVEDDLSAPDIVIVFGLIVAPTEDGTTYLFINPETAQLRPWITTPVSMEPLARSSITPFRESCRVRRLYQGEDTASSGHRSRRIARTEIPA